MENRHQFDGNLATGAGCCAEGGKHLISLYLLSFLAATNFGQKVFERVRWGGG